MRRLIVTLVLCLVSVTLLAAPSPRFHSIDAAFQVPTPAGNLMVTTDSTSALVISPSSASSCGSAGPPTNFSNIRLTVDSANRLIVCGAGGVTVPGAAGDVLLSDGAGGMAVDTGNFKYTSATHLLQVGSGGVTDGTNYRIKWDTVNADSISMRNAADSAYATVRLGSVVAPSGVNIPTGGNATLDVGTVVECSTSSFRIDGCTFGSGSKIVWTNGTTSGTADVGLARNAAGVLEVNNGTAGTFTNTSVKTGAATLTAIQPTQSGATGVTTNDLGSIRDTLVKITVDRTAFVCAATTCDVTVVTIPAKTWIKNVIGDLTTTFACASTCTTSTLSMVLGRGAGAAEFLASLDADAATGQFGDADAELGTQLVRASAIQGGVLSSWSATTNVVVRLTSGTGNIGTGAATNLSQGSITFYLWLLSHQ